MGIMDLFRKKPEIRADTEPEVMNDVLLRSLLKEDIVTKEMALQIPTVQACISLISDTISKLPLQILKKNSDGDVEIVDNDIRVRLLNDDTGDTLTAKMFWHAILEDYYLGKGGYAYIERGGRFFQSVRYVDERDVSIGYNNYDPIFKEYDLLIRGIRYQPRDFIKILRRTHDGMQSKSLVQSNPLLISVAYNELLFELAQAKKGGAKRGFLQADRVIGEKELTMLKEGFRKLYGSSDENVIVLNKGTVFHEVSSSAAELQMNENKTSNAEEICKLFGIPASMVCGSSVGNSMTDKDMNQFVRACVTVMTDIECSLNRDFLLESEKGTYYWKFDTKELTRGSIKERYEAYKIGLDKNFLQIDEVREMEDMEPLGIDWMLLNLNTVFYDTNTKEIYTPNTNAKMNLATGEGANVETTAEGGEKSESGTTS